MGQSSERPLVVFSRSLPGKVDIPHAEIRRGPEQRMSREDYLWLVRGASILVTWVSERVDREVLEAVGPSLKAVCNFAVGTDNIDLKACKERGVAVTNTPNAVTEGTADLAWALILGVARRLVEA